MEDKINIGGILLFESFPPYLQVLILCLVLSGVTLTLINPSDLTLINPGDLTRGFFGLVPLDVTVLAPVIVFKALFEALLHLLLLLLLVLLVAGRQVVPLLRSRALIRKQRLTATK